MSSKANKSSEVKKVISASSQRSKKHLNITVHFLDGSSHCFQEQEKNLGQVLFDKVCKHINLLEVDYFGLECDNEKGIKYWLDVSKPLSSQLHSSSSSMHFHVKFYTPDPVQLEDELTRYLFSLQIKKDLQSGALQCSDNTAAILVSYIVQADLGDFDPDKCIDHSYLSSYKFVSHQDAELEKKILENHKKLIGQTPAEAELNLLETARRCELYGVKMTPAKDQEGVPLNLAVVHLGVLVFQNFTKINTFSWAKIRKLSFKRKKFLIKLHPEGYGYYKDTVEFFFEGRNECKNFWKKCIENHTFFRCTDAKQGMRLKPKIFSRGSSFRYRGRTQKQVSEFVREQSFKRSPFHRSTSLKTPTSPSRNINSAITPQPLLPVTSMSCSSISDIPKEAIPSTKSTSEPSTPHIALSFGNGDCSRNSSTGVMSPESELEGFQSSDFCTQDPDDNISHDSYQVIEKEAVAVNPANKVLESVNNNANKMKNNFSDHYSNNLKDKEILRNNNNIFSDKSLIENNHPLATSTPNASLSSKQEAYTDTKSEHLSSLCLSDQQSVTEKHFSEQSFEDLSFKDSEQNIGASTFYISSPYVSRLSNKKRVLNDQAYCLTKELLMTERTYRKDLEIINVIFREEFSVEGKNVHSEAVEQLLTVVDPLYEMHCSLLRDLEQRLAFWEGRQVNQVQHHIKGIADLLLQQKGLIKVYSTYLESIPRIFEQLHQELNHSPSLAEMYQKFESQKVCYLPISSFLLRPTFRPLYYSSFLTSLLKVYNSDHEDYNNCKNMLERLKIYCENYECVMWPLVNFSKLMELQRNLIGFSSLVDKNRDFLREGCLSKITKNGSQQHMFFLFSDLLIFAGRSQNNRFKIKGQFSTDRLKVQETEPTLGFNHCFVLCSPERHLLVASPSTLEHKKWMADMERAVQKTSSQRTSSTYSLDEKVESGDEDLNILKKERSHHVNTSVHICWHRNISISRNDLFLSMKNSLSGYLLRKFKNSNGWQKVWVVLANFCLFFFRSYLDESSLASLPLSGYRITNTSNCDSISGDCIFKLSFKSHEYFFMVENKYSFERWMEAIHSCTLIEEENTHL